MGRKAFLISVRCSASVVPPHFGDGLISVPIGWYVLYVLLWHEKTVEHSLRVKGDSVFSPSYRTKCKCVDVGLAEFKRRFPGTFFVNSITSKRLPTLMTLGVVGVVGRGNRAVAVDSRKLNLHPNRCSRWTSRPALALRANRPRIRLQAGPLTGAEGIFSRVKDECYSSFRSLCYTAPFRSSSRSRGCCSIIFRRARHSFES